MDGSGSSKSPAAAAAGAQVRSYAGPAGGWGSLKSLYTIMRREETLPLLQLWRQNKPDGFACVSCAWAKPAKPHPFEFCENGAKATAWEMTRRRATPELFARHSVSEMLQWSDFDLEQCGRLTEPMRYDPASDHYVPVAWDEAFAAIGAALRGLDPKSVVFYASGRGSLETSYMYALLARLYGCNNLPDSSNMCHESTSVGLKASLGVPVGTVTLEDFEQAEAIFFFGQNVGSNSPRMLHPLQDARRRGVPIVTFNPLHERGLERFTNPQDPAQMLTGSETQISTQYHAVRAGGDIAAILGMCKALIEWDDQALAEGAGAVLDHPFIAEHTQGFETFAAFARNAGWPEIEHESGLGREAIEAAARVYAEAGSVLGVYGMGLTQHRLGVANVQMLVNLLLLRGNIGKPGAGPCPVRGHSNVQGQRTVGISERPELVPLDRLAQQYGFEPPRDKGLSTVEACEGIIAGRVKAFIGLGGNFVRATPDRLRMEPAWRSLELTVQIATRLNRSHLVNGRLAYLLPCLGRSERDVQAGGEQAVSVEDSTSCIHGSRGTYEPASPHLLSEPRIVAGIAKATLQPNPKVDWDGWIADYARVRDAIEQTYPEQFHDFNRRMWTPGGFPRPNPARERDWKTPEGKALFKLPPALSATGFDDEPGLFRLITLRSNDQFNTTVYGYHDRFRGVRGTREVLFMNPDDIRAQGLVEGERVSLLGPATDGVQRRIDGLMVTSYDIPPGCLGAYYPECNCLIPVWHHAEQSQVPASKSVPVRIERCP